MGRLIWPSMGPKWAGRGPEVGRKLVRCGLEVCRMWAESELDVGGKWVGSGREVRRKWTISGTEVVQKCEMKGSFMTLSPSDFQNDNWNYFLVKEENQLKFTNACYSSILKVVLDSEFWKNFHSITILVTSVCRLICQFTRQGTDFCSKLEGLHSHAPLWCH